MIGKSETATRDEEAVLTEVLRAIRALRHGSVQIIVQDARVVQIDTLEKKRFDRAAQSPSSGEGG